MFDVLCLKYYGTSFSFSRWWSIERNAEDAESYKKCLIILVFYDTQTNSENTVLSSKMAGANSTPHFTAVHNFNLNKG